MQLSELFEGVEVDGLPASDPSVFGITHDSRQVEVGDLFVGLVGEQFDGRAFAPDAVARGAVAVLAKGSAPSGFGGTWLSTEEPRKLLAPLAARLFEHPDEHLLTVGITGTNGKSTVAALLEEILTAAGRRTGSMGTLGYRFEELLFDGDRTTPEGSDLFRSLRKMQQAGAEAVVMEVSSHALGLARVAGLQLDLALFLNLTRDHFDFHGDFEAYFATKRRIFEHLKVDGRALVNLDDPYGRRLADELPDCITFGAEGDVREGTVELDLDGMRGTIETPLGRLEFTSQLLGRYNLDNILAAVAAAVSLELPLPAIAQGLSKLAPLSGRMEPVGVAQQPVFVDYAHTDAALSSALRSLRELSERRLVLVFGCGGDRDPGKRVLMGRAAGRYADLAIITSDNPRSEDPLQIISAIEEGVKESGSDAYRVIPDRREAIRRAIHIAGENGVVLVAGKGHERVQILGDQVVPFSDQHEVLVALEERFGSAPSR